LANLYTAFGIAADFNPMTGNCTVNHVGIDALFDAVTITIDTETGAVEVKALDDTVLVAATTTTIDEAIAVTLDDATAAKSHVMWGTYNYCELYLDTPSGGNGATAAAGHITFDADGNWTLVNEATSGSGLDANVSGTYSIDSTGSVWIGDSQYGVVTPDGEVMVLPDLDATEGLDVGLTILCKRDADLALTDISGEYVVTDLYRDTPAAGSGASAGVSIVEFDGNGTYTTAVGHGTYAVDANGRFAVDGGEDFGMVAMGGDVIVLPDYNPIEGNDLGISVMVRTSTAAGWGVASIDADYNMAEMFADVAVTGDSAENAVNTAGGVLSFDGAGTLSLTIGYSSAGDTGSADMSYTAPTSYGVELLDCMLADDSYGFFSPNGYLLVVPDEDTNEGGDVGITLGVQTW